VPFSGKEHFTMASKKRKSSKPLYPVEACWFGRKFVAAVGLGFADFQEKYRGKILSDSTLYQLFGDVGETRDLAQMGFFVGFVVGLHENQVKEIPSHLRLMNLGQGSIIECPSDSFVRGYQDGVKTFHEQCQTVCETGWDLDARLQVLSKKQCVRKFITDSRTLYGIGKATGYWISFAKQSSLHGALLEQKMKEADNVVA
jgi:hypothetical protein